MGIPGDSFNVKPRPHYAEICHLAMLNDNTKNDVDVILARAICQSFANWHARPNPTNVGQDQRKPSGKIKWGRVNWQCYVPVFSGNYHECASFSDIFIYSEYKEKNSK